MSTLRNTTISGPVRQNERKRFNIKKFLLFN